LAPASVNDSRCLALHDRSAAASSDVRVWSVASDLGVPAFLCQIRDPSPADPRWLRRFQGSGCHPDPGIALVRALTEAAQTRLTYIAGIRDDLLPHKYQEPVNAEIADALLDVLAQQCEPVAFAAVPGIATDDLAQDLRALVG